VVVVLPSVVAVVVVGAVVVVVVVGQCLDRGVQRLGAAEAAGMVIDRTPAASRAAAAPSVTCRVRIALA
jgi:hypothetical protein